MINLSQKEKFYLEDHKNNEQICIKKYNDYANQTQSPQLKQIFLNNAKQEENHLNTINQILSGQVPNMNTLQGAQGMQNTGQNMQAASVSGQFNQKDKDLCTDMLMTEKHVSSTYNTAIFEFKDPSIRQVLNHIQKEEQQHGEAIFKYMQSNGMYNIQ